MNVEDSLLSTQSQAPVQNRSDLIPDLLITAAGSCTDHSGWYMFSELPIWTRIATPTLSAQRPDSAQLRNEMTPARLVGLKSAALETNVLCS